MPDIFNIAGRIHSTSKEMVTTDSDEILDEALNKKQKELNRNFNDDLYGNEGLKGRVHALEEQVSFDGDFQVASTASEVIGGSGKITDGNAVRGAIDVRTGYFVCETVANLAEKVVSAAGFVLTNGGALNIKMINANAADNATLNINSTGAKALIYDGARASAANSWEDGEVLEVYYDSVNEQYVANNAAGGGKFQTGEKVKETGIDNTPTTGSENLVKSGGVQNELALGAVYDVSAKNPTAGPNSDGKWESLSALLSDANLSTLIPTSVRRGGMSIKFVHSVDNIYMQYMYIGTSTTAADFTNESNWEKVNLEKELEPLTSNIHTTTIQTTENSIDIEDDDGNTVVHVDKDGLNAKNIRSNGVELLPKVEKIETGITDNDNEEQIWCDDSENEDYAKIGSYGVKAKAYLDMNGNPILSNILTTYIPPVLHCDFKDSGLMPYPITDLKDGAITYDITADSLVIHNPQMLSSSFCIRIDGCESGKRYRIEGNGSGIDSTKDIYGYYYTKTAYGRLATLQNDGTGKYSAEFEVPANVQAYLSLAPRYTMAETSLTNIKLVDLDDVEREVINNDYLKNIGVETLSDNLKFLLGVDGFPTSYNGDSASVFRNVLFIGDSLTEGVFNKKADPDGQSAEERADTFKRAEYSYPEFFKDISSCDGDNWGIGGATAPDWYSAITTQSSPFYKTDEQWANHDCIIINLGTNDALRETSLVDTVAALNNIIDKAKSTNNGSIVFLCTTWGGLAFNGAGFDSVNEAIRGIASNRDDCILLDMNRYSHMNIDGYNNGHFTAIGYRRLAKDVHNYISYLIDTNTDKFSDIQFNNTDYER